ncbi:MAG TPA: biotin--[acetyl-CoA-carboxylase] ligase [Rhizomicrobium sp.]|nr:biotin--[acetyl-CoA-carboxylase] ligase [Rhizomicrobium sp.]
MNEAWPQGYLLRHLEEADSTNEEARRLAMAGAAAPLWILADRQTKGRGRRGREWQAPAGNLTATLLLRPESPLARCAQLSFTAALAAAGMIAQYAPAAEVSLKWPNDVLVHGRKIAGILLESAGNAPGRPDWLAIGIGANLAAHPTDVEFPATSLAALGAQVPAPQEALASLAAQWARWYELWMERGFGPVRDAWLARAAGLGTRIRARLAGGETHGMFEGIDEGGALLLRESPGRLRVISAGEVFF